MAPTLGPFLRLYLSGRGPPRLWVAIWVANRDRQLDGPPANIAEFNTIVGLVFAQLYERFPVPIEHLQLADKAARTVVLLTERLDHHRGRGQQQITVRTSRHVRKVPRNGHADSVPQCPLSGASRKHVLALSFSGFGPILLQKSKIERPGESRESRFLDAPAVARLSGANTKVGGRFGMKGCGPSCRRA